MMSGIWAGSRKSAARPANPRPLGIGVARPNESGIGARHRDDADGSALPQHWYPEAAAKAERAAHDLNRELQIELEDLGYVNDRALEDCPSCHQRPGWARWEDATHLLESFGGDVVPGNMLDQLAIELKEPAEEATAEPDGALRNRVEHRLNVGRRAGDDAQDLAGGRLLLQALGHLRMRLRQALLEFVSPRSSLLRCLTGERALGFRLNLRGLCTATHQPLVASPSTAIDDSLGG